MFCEMPVAQTLVETAVNNTNVSFITNRSFDNVQVPPPGRPHTKSSFVAYFAVFG